MKKEIREVDHERQIFRCTTLDERHYSKVEPDPVTGVPQMFFRPSVTWIVGFYPKGKGFEIYLKSNGFEADEIVKMRGEIGSKTHLGIGELNRGKIVTAEDRFPNSDTGISEELNGDEWAGIWSYWDWWETEGKQRFKILRNEFVTWPDAAKLAEETGLPKETFLYAGTVDLELLEIATGLRWIVDMKISPDVYASHEMQVNAYRVAERADRQAILQLNYRRNKIKKYKFTEIPDKFRLFRATRAIFDEETGAIGPPQREYPLSLSLSGL